MERLIRIVIAVGLGLINHLSTRGGANRDDLRLTARPVAHLPIIAALAISMLLGVLPAILPQSSAHAASAYLADEIGNTEITVDAGDDFQVVLYVVDITGVAGYECKITVSGPATPTGSAVHGDWFADGHTVFDGIDPVPADYHTAMLISPSYVSGSGAVVVFTLRADDDGIVAINVDSEYFLFATSSGSVIELDLPSTLYVTVGTGEGLQGGGGEQQQQEEESSGEGMDSLSAPVLSIRAIGPFKPNQGALVGIWVYQDEEPYYEYFEKAAPFEMYGLSAGMQIVVKAVESGECDFDH